MLKDFTYKFNEGPLASIRDLLGDWKVGNCRRAVQYYIYKKRKIFLKPKKVLCPGAYYETGVLVISSNSKFNPELLLDGDIIYAEKVRNKEKEVLNKSVSTFIDSNEYIISLHTALYTNQPGEEIWHASSIEGKSSFWSLDKFLYFYKPIIVKRITNTNS